MGKAFFNAHDGQWHTPGQPGMGRRARGRSSGGAGHQGPGFTVAPPSNYQAHGQSGGGGPTQIHHHYPPGGGGAQNAPGPSGEPQGIRPGTVLANGLIAVAPGSVVSTPREGSVRSGGDKKDRKKEKKKKKKQETKKKKKAEGNKKSAKGSSSEELDSSSEEEEPEDSSSDSESGSTPDKKKKKNKKKRKSEAKKEEEKKRKAKEEADMKTAGDRSAREEEAKRNHAFFEHMLAENRASIKETNKNMIHEVNAVLVGHRPPATPANHLGGGPAAPQGQVGGGGGPALGPVVPVGGVGGAVPGGPALPAAGGGVAAQGGGGGAALPAAQPHGPVPGAAQQQAPQPAPQQQQQQPPLAGAAIPAAAAAGAAPPAVGQGAGGIAGPQDPESAKLDAARTAIAHLYAQNLGLQAQIQGASDWDELNAFLVAGQTRDELQNLVDLLQVTTIAPAERRRLSKSKLLDAVAKVRWDIGQ